MMSLSRAISGFVFLTSMTCVLAFELTLYQGVTQCSAESDTMYRIIHGPSSGFDACYNFDSGPEGMDLVSCDQYNNGGAEGPVGCSADPLFPRSVRQVNGARTCQFYSKRDCQGSLHEVAGERACLTSTDVGVENYQSFTCDWDGSIDVIANVGCHDGVSTDACVNDCNCHCVGQNLLCVIDGGSIPIGCSPKAAAVCEKLCDCINP